MPRCDHRDQSCRSVPTCGRYARDHCPDHPRPGDRAPRGASAVDPRWTLTRLGCRGSVPDRRRRGLVAFAVVAVLALVGWGVLPGISPDPLGQSGSGTGDATESVARGSGNDSSIDPTAVEEWIHRFVDEEREARGLSPLATDADLRSVAQYHSDRMVEEGFFGHESPSGATHEDRYRRFDYECRIRPDVAASTGAETLAYHYDDPRGRSEVDAPAREVARAVVTRWMNSDRNRRKIVSPDWRRHGVGVSIDGPRVYVTQNFC